ncbi:diguanylate cyclase [Oceanobacillus picturae]|uniref:Diguanylate cyclase n=1 Tax=Oceanobacillus picturae TaxID=171693 RepID=A0A0U9H9N7_9BACI|nr:hypothetical protein [Oceanobacillus picturae]GAQ19131.1 diguanylate cyclase [Oceanobacillus picturae]
MKKFTNNETTIVSKWLGDEIDIILNDAETEDKLELISVLSEKLEKEIMNDLQFVTEGFVSEIIHSSLEKIDYNELIDYYKE